MVKRFAKNTGPRNAARPPGGGRAELEVTWISGPAPLCSWRLPLPQWQSLWSVIGTVSAPRAPAGEQRPVTGDWWEEEKGWEEEEKSKCERPASVVRGFLLAVILHWLGALFSSFPDPRFPHCGCPRHLGVRRPPFPGLGVSAAIMAPYSESLGLRIMGLVQPFLGVRSSLRVLFPKAHSFAEALFGLYLQPWAGKLGGRQNPGGRGVSGETGLGENVTDVASLRSHCKACSECAFSIIRSF